MSATLKELDEEFAALETIVEEMRQKLNTAHTKAKEQPKWSPPDGEFVVYADGLSRRSSIIGETRKRRREFGTVRSTSEAADKAASRMRFFNRTLTRLEQMGWDRSLNVHDNDAHDVVITFMNSSDISFEFLKEVRDGKLDL